ncbi:hypothetical protein ACQJBY_015412 [Aegilops geniculata]
MCRRPVVVSALSSLRHPIGLHLAKLRPGRTRRKQRGRLWDEEEISVSMQPTHPHHPSSCADSSNNNSVSGLLCLAGFLLRKLGQSFELLDYALRGVNV